MYKVLLLVVFLCSAPSPSLRADSPISTVEKFWGEIRQLAAMQDVAVRDNKIRELIEQNFRFLSFYQRALADHWNQWDETEKTSFDKCFRRHFSVKVAQQFETLAAQMGQALLHHTARRTSFGYEVITQAKEGRDSFTITTNLQQENGAWKIIDVNLDGALLSRNYQGHFNNILRRYGYFELIKRLENTQI